MVLYVCKTWSLTIGEVLRLRVFENKVLRRIFGLKRYEVTKVLRRRVFENKVLRRIFGLKRYEVTRGRRKLHNKELLNLYASPSIMRMIKLKRWAGHVA
jgi:hypothetical protein